MSNGSNDVGGYYAETQAAAYYYFSWESGLFFGFWLLAFGFENKIAPCV